jgi:hypothetical protein
MQLPVIFFANELPSFFDHATINPSSGNPGKHSGKQAEKGIDTHSFVHE